VIASYLYQDAELRRLTAPAHDAESLAAVLRDPDIAGFEVTTLINEPHHQVGEVIGDFYRDRGGSDDLTLLYFTGHGLKDDDGRLYLAMANTRRDSLLFTSLPAEQIDYAMSGSKSRQKVLILDCCYSGAFPAGRLAKADTAVDVLEQLQGRGRVVLTASNSIQYSFEGKQLHGDAAQSVFTRYLVAGLRDGSADLNNDGHITLDELYSYVHDRVVEEMPQQRPKKKVDLEGHIIIARNINWSTNARNANLLLPQYLCNALNSPIAKDRHGALNDLDRLYWNGDDIVRACVKDEIQHLADDDSRLVSAAAAAWLRSLLPKPPERPIEHMPEVSKLEAKKVSESRAGATVPPSQRTRSSVPGTMRVQPPDRGSSATPPPRQPTGEPQSAQPSNTSRPGPSKKRFRPERDSMVAARARPPRWRGVPLLGVVSVLTLGLGLGLVGLPVRTPDGATPTAAAPFQAPVGTCITWTRTDASDAERVRCPQPHLFEVTGVVDLAPEFGRATTFPVDETWRTLVAERCTPLSTQFLGGRFDPFGRLSVGAIKPSEGSWRSGDRALRCGLQAVGRSGVLYPSTGSATTQDQSNIYAPGTCLGLDGVGVGDPVDCAQPHAVEVVGVVDLGPAFPGGYPDEVAQDKLLSDECNRLAAEYAGGPQVVGDKKLIVFSETLRPESWEVGSRRVDCRLGAFLPDRSGFAPVTGSVRGEVQIGAEPAPPLERTQGPAPPAVPAPPPPAPPAPVAPPAPAPGPPG